MNALEGGCLLRVAGDGPAGSRSAGAGPVRAVWVWAVLGSSEEMRQLSSFAAAAQASQGEGLHALFQKFPSYIWFKPRSRFLCLLLSVLGAFM